MKYEDVIAYIIRYGLGGALVAALLATVLSLSGCKTLPHAIVPEVHNNYNGHDQNNTSSEKEKVYIHDSIFIREKGDTVFVDRYQFRDRWFVKTDSIIVYDSIHVRDSIPYPVEVLKTVPRERSGYDRFCSWWFWITAVLLLIKIAAWIMEKFPATAPYVILLRRFVPFL